MPFIEITDAGNSNKIRKIATRSITEALCEAYEISPEIVTCYYQAAPKDSYGHAGNFGNDAEYFRIFVKLHAFPRPQQAKEKAAKLITEALSRTYDTDPKHVALYFMDRNPSDAFHAGLASA